MKLRKLLIVCPSNDEPARRVLDEVATRVRNVCGVAYGDWKHEGGCRIRRVPTESVNEFPVFVQGVLGMDLAAFEGRNQCVLGEGVAIITNVPENIPEGIALFPPRNYFRGVQLGVGEAVLGMRRLCLLKKTVHTVTQTVNNAATAIMLCLESMEMDGIVFLSRTKSGPGPVSPWQAHSGK